MKEYKDVMSKPDSIVPLGRGSLIQHGKQNDRIYLMKLAEEDVTLVFNEISRLLALYDYSKVFLLNQWLNLRTRAHFMQLRWPTMF